MFNEQLRERLALALAKKPQPSRKVVDLRPAPASTPAPAPSAPPPARLVSTPAPLPAAKSTHEINTSGGKVWIIPKLTPEMATELLKHQHPGQRPISENHVEAIARSMSSGTYVWTGDPVRFDRNNLLIDGQHRLTAVVLSNVTLEDVLCVKVSDDEVHKYIDTAGKSRSSADIRRFLGQRQLNSSVVAAVAMEFCDFKQENRTQLTKVEVNELVETCEYVQDLLDLVHTGKSSVKLTAAGLAAALRCMRANHEQSLVFFRAVCSNNHTIDGEFQPVIKLTIDWLMRESTSRSASRSSKAVGDVRASASNFVVANKLIRAYNAWRLGENLSILQAGRTDKIHVPVS